MDKKELLESCVGFFRQTLEVAKKEEQDLCVESGREVAQWVINNKEDIKAYGPKMLILDILNALNDAERNEVLAVTTEVVFLIMEAAGEVASWGEKEEKKPEIKIHVKTTIFPCPVCEAKGIHTNVQGNANAENVQCMECKTKFRKVPEGQAVFIPVLPLEQENIV